MVVPIDEAKFNTDERPTSYSPSLKATTSMAQHVYLW